MHTSLQLHPKTNWSVRTNTTPEKSKIKVRQMLTLVDYVPQPLQLLVQQWYKKHVTEPILFFNIQNTMSAKFPRQPMLIPILFAASSSLWSNQHPTCQRTIEKRIQKKAGSAPQSSASLENIEEVLRLGQQLQVACACGRPNSRQKHSETEGKDTQPSRYSIHKVEHFTNVLESQSVKTAYFVPGMSLDLRELELCVVWVHALDLLPCWGAQNLGNQTFNYL